VDALVVLGDEIHGEIMGQHLDVRVFVHAFQQGAFDFVARDVLVVQDAVFGMAALARQIVVFPVHLVEIRAVGYQFADAFGRFFHHVFDYVRMAQPVPGNRRVSHVLVETVGRVHHRRHAALRVFRVRFVLVGLRHDQYFSQRGRLQRKAQPGDPGPDNQKINFPVCHVQFERCFATCDLRRAY